jgi:hypothetical protein
MIKVKLSKNLGLTKSKKENQLFIHFILTQKRVSERKG